MSGLHNEGEGSFYSRRPTASVNGLSSSISRRNFSSFSDWTPSDWASSGLGWTSIRSPSAPHAIPAFAIGATYSQWPVPWLGSTMTGRGGGLLRTGAAVESRVEGGGGSEGRV